MATVPAVSRRQALSRLKLEELRQICKDLSIDYVKKKKAEIIEAIMDKTSSIKENTAPSSRSTVHFEDVGYMANLVPPVKFLHVYNHIVEKSGRNSKCLDRGIKHFDEGDIQELCYKQISDSEIWFRATCVASQRQKKYTVYVSVDKDSGACMSGKCDCSQGLSGNCSHASGLLLALEFINRTKAQNPGDISCTSQLCKWKKPRKVKVTPKPLAEIDIHKPGYGKVPSIRRPSDFEPRAPEH